MASTQSVETPIQRYHPIQASMDKIEQVGTSIYNRMTPKMVDSVLRDSRVVGKTTQTAVAIIKAFDPIVTAVDSYASALLEWGVSKYNTLFVNNVLKLMSTFKDFYSSENNDFARVVLRFLTLAIPQPDYLDITTLEKFLGSFKYDPQFGTEKFQKILVSFFKHAKNHWMVNRASKPLEIVQNALYVVAGTMEEILIPVTEKVPNYAKKMSDYFINAAPSRTLFSRKHFRAFYKSLMQERHLSESEIKLSDQYLQIASVLFDLTSMSNKDLVDWTIHSFKFAKSGVESIMKTCRTTSYTILETVVRITPVEPVKAICQAAYTQAQTLYEVGKDGLITVYHKVLDMSPLQVCLDMAYQLDLVLRNKGHALIRLFKVNKRSFIEFVKLNRDDIILFIREGKSILEEKGAETKEAVIQFLSTRAEDLLDIADVGKDVKDLAVEVVADYATFYKEKASGLVFKYYQTIRKETKQLPSLVFRVLRVDEISSFVLRFLKSVEEYLCIKESLSKLDLLTSKTVSEVDHSHLLDSPTIEQEETELVNTEEEH